MIRHIVFVSFDPAVPDSERTQLFTELAGLQTVVQGMRGFAGGSNVSPEALAKGFTHAFTVDFDDVAARDAYLVHPAHKAVGAKLVGATVGGVEGLAVMDIAIDP